MKKFFVCTNLKINLSIEETLNYTKRLVEYTNYNLPDNSNVEVFFFPDFISMYPVSKMLGHSKLGIGSQNCFWKETGAFTGEVSIKSLKEINCKYIMVGHPERLLIFNEDLEMVNKKIHTIIKNDLTAVAFIVEKEKDTNIKNACNKLKEQIEPLLKDVEAKDLNKIVLFYEPAWAIGTLSAAPVEHTNYIIMELRNLLDSIYGLGIGSRQVFFYGGGVTLESAKAIIETGVIDGIGMGKAALDFDFFSKLIDLAIKLKKNS